VLDFTAGEWRWVILGFAIIWIAEALNTAVERLGDAVAPARNKAVGLAKDIAASAVFIAIMAASLIGVSLFLPHLVDLLD
jgi:diacylglycerol kinase (ATP)